MRSRLTVACLPAIACMAIACEKPVVMPVGQQAKVGGVSFDVGQYDVRFLELHEGSQTIEYTQPVLAIPITVTNTGEGPIQYSPSHSVTQMSEGAPPLLYPAPPSAETPLPPATKQPINGVIVPKGQVAGRSMGSARSSRATPPPISTCSSCPPRASPS